MSYWDSAAIVPLLIVEKRTAYYSKLRERETIVTWWGTPVECASALARKFRERTLTAGGFAASLSFLDQLQKNWTEIQPSVPLRQAAIRFLRIYPLRAADALQLAAAVVASDFDPAGRRFLSEDDRLKSAAEGEGFVVH